MEPRRTGFCSRLVDVMLEQQAARRDFTQLGQTGLWVKASIPLRQVEVPG